MIPKSAKLVFKGKFFDIYRWRQRMFDGSYETFERVKRLPSVQVIAAKGNKVLLLKERHPARRGIRYSVPGGRMEEGESPLEAAKRELLEETGMAASKWKLLKTYRESGWFTWDVYLYLAKDCRWVREAEPDPGEKIVADWVSLDGLLDAFTKKHRNIIMDFVSMRYDNAKRKAFREELFG